MAAGDADAIWFSIKMFSDYINYSLIGVTTKRGGFDPDFVGAVFLFFDSISRSCRRNFCLDSHSLMLDVICQMSKPNLVMSNHIVRRCNHRELRVVIVLALARTIIFISYKKARAVVGAGQNWKMGVSA